MIEVQIEDHVPFGKVLFPPERAPVMVQQRAFFSCGCAIFIGHSMRKEIVAALAEGDLTDQELHDLHREAVDSAVYPCEEHITNGAAQRFMDTWADSHGSPLDNETAIVVAAKLFQSEMEPHQ